MNSYIEMPEGIESLKTFEAFNQPSSSDKTRDLYINAAVGIDKLGRVMYNNLKTTRGAYSCKEVAARRLAIAYVSALSTALLGGPAWVVTTMAVCDIVATTATYKNCDKRKK